MDCHFIYSEFVRTACTLVEGMQSPAIIPSEWITSEPVSLTLDNLRPNNDKTWSAPNDVQYKIIVMLAEEPVSVAGINIDGNVVVFTVSYKERSDQPFHAITDDDSATPKVLFHQFYNHLLSWKHMD